MYNCEWNCIVDTYAIATIILECIRPIQIFQFGYENEKYSSKSLYDCGRNNPTRMESNTNVKCHKDTIQDYSKLSQSNFQRAQIAHQSSEDKRREGNKLIQQVEANASGFDMIVS